MDGNRLKVKFYSDIQKEQKIVIVEDTELVIRITNATSIKEKRKIVEKYLIDTYVGKTISKEYLDKRSETKTLFLKETGGDIKELTFKRGDDVLKSLTLLEQLIEASEYDSEAISSKRRGKNDYYWYFKVFVKVDDRIFAYKLNVGRNRYTGNIALYSITNYKKTRHGDF